MWITKLFKKQNSGKIVLVILIIVILFLGNIAFIEKANAAWTFVNGVKVELPYDNAQSGTKEEQANLDVINAERARQGLAPINEGTTGLQASKNDQQGLNPNTRPSDTAINTSSLLFVIVSITASLITLVGFLMNFALSLGNQVITLDIVKIGSGVVLGFANLGFVMAIIVMAFATIFRVQSYAMKQTLWKLIVAALLVNFSLVIAGGIISVSNSFTDYFYSQSTGTSLADGLAGVLNPGEFLKIASKDSESWISMVISAIGGIINYFIKYAISLVMILILSFIILLTFFTLFIMFLIRAVYLGILLILMPIVWLLWIFPATKHLWQKWWKEFIRWNFFAPAVLFFIFLVIKAGKTMNQIDNLISNTSQVDTTTFQEALAKSNFLDQNFLKYTAQEVIITGLLLGGLFAANSLGITFASTAYGWAQSAGKGVGKWMGRETLEQTGGRFFANQRVKNLTERLSTSRIPGVRFMGRGLNRLGAQTEKTLQAGYVKSAKDLTPDRLNYEILNSRGVRQAVFLQEAAKRKDINMVKLAPLFNSPKEMRGIENDFGRAGIDFKDLTRAVGRTPGMVEAAADMEKFSTPGMKKAEIEMMEAEKRDDKDAQTRAQIGFEAEAIINSQKKNYDEAKVRRDEESGKFIQSQAPKHWAKGQWDDFFKSGADTITRSLQEAMATNFAKFEHGAYAKITPQIKPHDLQDFRKIMEKGIKDARSQAQARISDPVRLNAALKNFERAEERLGNTLLRRAEYGEEAWMPPGQTTTPT